MSFYVEYEYLCLPKMNTPQAVIMSGKKIIIIIIKKAEP
jgi:hypothetical protein